MPDTQANFSCANCAIGGCAMGDSARYPGFCPTANSSQELVDGVTKRYTGSRKDHKMALVAASIESDYYGRATRVEESLLFVKKMGYKKIGVASCVGLLAECNTFAKIARAKGIEVYGVGCKVGSVDKTVIGIPDESKFAPGSHEAMCNPILQAELLNREGTDFNFIMGLCLGHDTLFIKHSKAPVSVLVVKDRVLCHNPAAALYTTGTYYRRLLGPDLPEPVHCG
ncbi:MAG: DUF1847 domain-containing protein [Christensenellaceae bacterium]|jgi:uncharacterized metal-binding protein|nr:DUF1847 domain-containing protein [Christensenellaceae bacterium]